MSKRKASWAPCGLLAVVQSKPAILSASLAFMTWHSVTAATFTDFTAFQAAAGPLTTDDFESGPWATSGSKPKPTVNLGVSWTAQDDLFVSTTSSRSGFHTLSDIDGNGTRDQLFATLPAGVHAAGGWIHGFLQGTSTSLLAYSVNNVLLDSVTIPDPGSGFAFMGVINNQAIDHVEFRKPPIDGANDDFSLDDFSFGNVPEPASVALAGLGLLIAALSRQRCRR